MFQGLLQLTTYNQGEAVQRVPQGSLSTAKVSCLTFYKSTQSTEHIQEAHQVVLHLVLAEIEHVFPVKPEL